MITCAADSFGNTLSNRFLKQIFEEKNILS